MIKALKLSAIAVTALGLGLAGPAAVGASSINGNDEDSNNAITTTVDRNWETTTTNDVTADFTNDQTARSGNATVEDNDDTSGVMTGNASNEQSTDATIDVMTQNGGANWGDMSGNGMGGGTISDNDEDSDNSIDYTENTDVRVNTNNNVSVTSSNTQNATSGSVTVEDNDDAGDVRTGDAMNSSTNSYSVSVHTTN